MTVPNLPLQHGDNAALTCLAGHLIVKKGEIKAICLYGQVLTTNKPLECLSIGRLFDELVNLVPHLLTTPGPNASVFFPSSTRQSPVRDSILHCGMRASK